MGLEPRKCGISCQTERQQMVFHTFIQLLIYQSISAHGKTKFSNSQILADSATLTTDKGRF